MKNPSTMRHQFYLPTVLCCLAMLYFLLGNTGISEAQALPIIQTPSCDSSNMLLPGQPCVNACVGDTFCYGVSLVPGGSYVWTFTGNIPTIVSGNNTNTICVVWTAPGNSHVGLDVYVNGVIKKEGGGCIDVSEVIASISSTPAPVNGCVRICKDATVTFSNVGSPGGAISEWDFGDGSPVASGSTVTHPYTMAGTYTVILTSHTDCCYDTAQYCVTVDALPGPDIECITAVCGNQQGVQYCTTSNCGTYNWNIPLADGTITSTIPYGNCINVDWNAGPTGTISLACDQGCLLPTVITVPIMPSGPFSIVGPQTVCATCPAGTYTYAAPYIPGAQYTWMLTDVSTATTTTLPISSPPYLQDISFCAPGPYTLTCHMENDVLDCKGDASIQIAIAPDYSISGNTSLCEGAQGTYSALQNFSPFAVNWEITNSLGMPVYTSTLLTSTPPFVFTTAGTYTVTATAAPGSACNLIKTLTVVVNPTPVITGYVIPSFACPGGVYNYSATASSPTATISWSSTTPGVTFMPSSGPSVTVTYSYTFTGTASIEITPDEGGCTGPNSTVSVNAYINPAPLISSVDVNVCPDAIGTYTAIPTYPASVLTWSIFPASAGTITSAPGVNPITVHWNSIIPNNSQNAQVILTETVCNNLSGTFMIPVAIKPSAVLPPAQLTICPNTTTALTAPGGNGFTWYYADGILAPPLVPPGNYYGIGGMDANGCPATVLVAIGTFPTPVVTVGSTTPDCTNGLLNTPVILTATAGFLNYEWTNGPPTNPNNTYNVTSLGIYAVTVTDINTCKATSAPATVSCGCPVQQCGICMAGSCTNGVLNSPVTLDPNDVIDYDWYKDGVSLGIITPTLTVNIPGLYTVYLSNSNDSSCVSVAQSYAVICEGDPCPFDPSNCTFGIATAMQSMPNCEVWNFTASSNCPGSNFQWDFGDGSLVMNGASVSHPYSAAGHYVVKCYLLNDSCPTFDAVDVIVPIAAEFTYLATNCGQTVSFTNTSGVYMTTVVSTWDFGDGPPVVNVAGTTPVTHTYSTAGTHLVTLTLTSLAGCTSTVSHLVYISFPAITPVIAATGCNGPVAFSVSQDMPFIHPIVSWMWDFGDGGAGSNTPVTTHTFLAPGLYYITVTAIDALGCTVSVLDSIIISAPPSPVALNFISPLCGASVISVVADPQDWTVYTSYDWSNNGTSTGATSYNYTATISGNYSVVVSDINGCIIPSNIATVIVNPLPPINLTVSPNPICSNDILTLHSGASSPFEVKWFDITQSFLFNGYDYILPAPLPAGTYKYICEVTDTITMCRSIDTITFTVGASPTVSASADPEICAPNGINITASASPVVNYQWSTGATTPIILVYSSGIYTVTVTDPTNGCTASASATATINPKPDLSLLPIGCDSSCLNIDSIIHGPTGMSAYAWYVNGVFVSNAQDLTLNPFALPLSTPKTIKLIATTQDLCMDSTEFVYTPTDCDSIEDDCYDVLDTIWCNTDGTWSFQLMVQNYSAVSGGYILMNDFTMPFSVSGAPLYIPSALYYQSLYIPAGGNSGWFPSTPLILSVPPNTTVPTSFCFKSLIIFGDTCCYDTTCIEIPNCVPCDNISASSTDADSSCCKTVSLYNNYNGNYFTGIQVKPITPGATIGSSYLGNSYFNWSTNNPGPLNVTYNPPGGTFIPTGNTNGLFTMCLSLAPGTPSPQIVLLNWLATGSNGEDSVVCTDTLKFYCDSEPPNLCGTVEDTIICLGNDMYQYSFTLTNNSPNAINMAAVDWKDANAMTIGFPGLFLYSPPLASGASFTHTITFTTPLQAGSVICYHLTLLDSIGCCCHDVDTVCFILPDCDSLITCGDRSPYEVLVDNNDSTDYVVDINCGDDLSSYINKLPATITFTSGGYLCSDGNPSSYISWIVPGATPSSGTGYPIFTITTPGSYALTIYSLCDGKNLCDSCAFNFNVPVVETCACGSWTPLSVDITTPDGNISTFPDVPCGTTFSNISAGTMMNFTTGGYLCNPSNESCVAEITWSLPGAIPSSGIGIPQFTLPNGGAYTLILSANCGGIICEQCDYYFNVNMEEQCACNQWSAFNVSTTGIDGYTQDLQVACGDVVQNVANNTLIDFSTGGFSCVGGEACLAALTWSVTGNATPLSGTGLPSFTLISGTCTVSMSSSCGNNTCEQCIITFEGEQAPLCACNGWNTFKVSIGNLILLNQSCGNAYGCFSKNTTIAVNGFYDCVGGDICSKSLNWVIKKDNNFFASGSGMPITFTATQEGSYKVTINSFCNGLSCPPCIFTFTTTPLPCNKPFVSIGDVSDDQFTVQDEGLNSLSIKIEPNPAKESINVTVQSVVEENGELVLYNELGMIIKSVDAHLMIGDARFIITSDDLPAGAYLLRYNGVSQSAFSKVIVAR